MAIYREPAKVEKLTKELVQHVILSHRIASTVREVAREFETFDNSAASRSPGAGKPLPSPKRGVLHGEGPGALPASTDA